MIELREQRVNGNLAIEFGNAHSPAKKLLMSMTNTHRSFLLVSYACAAAVAGGINFYWTVDDTPLGPAMHAHGWWLTAWNVVAIADIGHSDDCGAANRVEIVSFSVPGAAA